MSTRAVRITIDLTPELFARLESLTETMGASSKADTVRNALRVFHYLASRHKDGFEFLQRKEDRVEVIPIFTII